MTYFSADSPINNGGFPNSYISLPDGKINSNISNLKASTSTWLVVSTPLKNISQWEG